MDPSQTGYRLDWRLPIPPAHPATRPAYHNEVGQDLRSSLPYGVDCMFHCGGCAAMYPMIWQLHEHLQLHATGGSYHYNHHTRTAFPKYDTTCHETQTDLESYEKESKVTNLVCTETQTEETLTNVFSRRDYTEDSNDDEEKNTGVNIIVKVETPEFQADSEFSKTNEGSDNEVKIPILTPDDPYSGDTDEGSNLWYPETYDDDEDASTDKTKNGETKDLVKNMIKNIKGFGNSKSIKKTVKERKEIGKKKKHSLKSNKKDLRKSGQRKQKKIDYATVKKPPIKCKYCNEYFANSLHVKRHCLKEHPSEKNYKCRYCEEAFVTEAEIQKHRKKHLREKYECHICKKHLSSTQNLQDHITMHTGEKMFECKDCGTYFRSRSQLSLHASRRHNPNFDHMCENCGRVFKCRQNLKGHIKICLDIRPFRCEICGKRFPRNTNLNVHMRKHTGEKPFVCHTCGMKFMHSNTLTKHMLVHTGERKYSCDLCGMKFKAHNALKDHIRIHNQEKRFTCQYCGKGFIKKCNMVTHIRQHTGETPYKCHICGQGYKQNVLLRTHMQTHKNEPPNLQSSSHQPVSPPQQQHIMSTPQHSQSMSLSTISQSMPHQDMSHPVTLSTPYQDMSRPITQSTQHQDICKSVQPTRSLQQLESIQAHSQPPESTEGYTGYMMTRM
ncbi:zinc finger protein 678-like [Mercenaria mercenaria]|uniref:zinc finger protein 678-like n=1 Tax=Mercenaria mercenaria TaxID=6596 RepID=UPI00234F042C|nr:zinc finger protein 678-like [Mercenaria mercenaria]